jgi:hypothetical protein
LVFHESSIVLLHLLSVAESPIGAGGLDFTIPNALLVLAPLNVFAKLKTPVAL